MLEHVHVTGRHVSTPGGPVTRRRRPHPSRRGVAYSHIAGRIDLQPISVHIEDHVTDNHDSACRSPATLPFTHPIWATSICGLPLTISKSSTASWVTCACGALGSSAGCGHLRSRRFRVSAASRPDEIMARSVAYSTEAIGDPNTGGTGRTTRRRTVRSSVRCG